MAMNAVKENVAMKEATVEETGVRSTASAGKRVEESVATSMAQSVVKKVEESVATSMAQSVVRKVDQDMGSAAMTTIAPVEAADMVEVTRDAMSQIDRAAVMEEMSVVTSLRATIDQVEDMGPHQATAEVEMMIRDAPKLSGTTAGPVAAVETTGDTNTDRTTVLQTENTDAMTVPQETLAALGEAMLATGAIRALTVASNRPAHPMAAATAAQTSFLAPHSTHNQAAASPKIRTSSVWLLEC